jgi:hypothetical protein
VDEHEQNNGGPAWQTKARPGGFQRDAFALPGLASASQTLHGTEALQLLLPACDGFVKGVSFFCVGAGCWLLLLGARSAYRLALVSQAPCPTHSLL